MDIHQILEELAYDLGELPREALEAAIAKREQITPYLMEILENAILRVDDVIEQDNYQGHLYAMYLLAQFREVRSYPLIVKLVSFPGDIPHAIAGDVLTEDLSRILASVYDGNISLIKEIIENPEINEYVRSAAIHSLVNLVGCGLKPRLKVIHYFKHLLREKLERTPSFVWDSLVSCCCALYPEELFDEICVAFQEGLVTPTLISLEDISKILNEKKESHLFRLFQNAELIDDTLAEMEKWLTAQTIVD